MIKELLSPLFQSEYLTKQPLNSLFRKFIVQMFNIYPPSSSNLPPTFHECGFYQHLSILLENIFRTEYGDISGSASKKADLKSRDPKPKPKSDQVNTQWNHLWSLQLVDDICMATNESSWIESIGGGIVLLCRQFIKKHTLKL